MAAGTYGREDGIAPDFHLLAETLQQIVWVHGSDGTPEFANRRALAYAGVAPGDLASAKLRARLLHPGDRRRVRSAWRAASERRTCFSVEARLRRDDGVYHWHLIQAHPMRDERGAIVKWMGTATDVHGARESTERSAFLLTLSTELARIGDPQDLVCTAMLRLRERLHATRATLAELDHEEHAVMLLTQSGDASRIEISSLPLESFGLLALQSRQGVTTAVDDTRRDSRSAQLHAEEFVPRGIGAFISVPLLRGGRAVALLSTICAEPRRWSSSEIELAERVADIVWPAFEKARADRALAASEERLRLAQSVARTERRHVEQALQEVNQRKDEFLAMLAHELRNPLAPIRNAAQILRLHAKGNPRLEWARAVIERQSRHLTRLVDDLLDVSRIVRGQITLEKSQVDLGDVVRHALETSRPLVRERKHQLTVSLPAEPLPLDADLTRLAQVVANLLINAAKYTPEGGHISLEAAQQSDAVALRVRDTGMGIAPALLPHVFDLFTQGARTLDRAQGGLGIGLTLVKKIVEMHGGTVEARSAGPGRGSEFVVRLPVLRGRSAVRRESEAPAGEAERGAPMRVLVVDDNIDAAESIAMLLALEGHDVRSVHAAHEALETARSFKPHVVLLDIGLPGMDGYEVARQLRSQQAIERMRLIAITGYGQQSDRLRAREAGFDQHLVKPVDPEALHAVLDPAAVTARH